MKLYSTNVINNYMFRCIKAGLQNTEHEEISP